MVSNVSDVRISVKRLGQRKQECLRCVNVGKMKKKIEPTPALIPRTCTMLVELQAATVVQNAPTNAARIFKQITM